MRELIQTARLIMPYPSDFALHAGRRRHRDRGFNSQTDAILEIAAVVLAMNAEGYLETEKSPSPRHPIRGQSRGGSPEIYRIDPFHPFGSPVRRRTSSKISFR